jgi:aspartyl-tRNA(Asn)/glutamyl-tRNA(Gln) amidotransferase subunit A
MIGSRLQAAPRARAASGASANLPQDPTSWSIRQASEALASGRISSAELTRACLARIDRLEPRINAFITVTPDHALMAARVADEERAEGRAHGALHGIPIALKDNIDTAGIPTTAASALFADRIPDADAEVVRRLKDAGAVSLGKLNLHEFAFGGTSVVTFYGPVRNPWNTAHSAGGSSGGSGAAVAAGLCLGALGTDTGGSIRIPAAWCGVVGLKPTYGRVSNRGVIPLCWSLDHVGPLARTVEDAATLLQGIAGYDAIDPSTQDIPVPDYVGELRRPARRLRVGVPRAAFFDNLSDEVRGITDQAIGVIAGLAAGIEDVRLPGVMTVPDALWGAEIAAYHQSWFPASSSAYQPATRRAIEGSLKTSAADYARALQQVLRLRRDVVAVFSGVDLLVTPCAAAPAWSIEESLRKEDSEKPLPPEMWTQWQFNIFGLPTIAVPCGFTRAGLPVGLQISGPHWGEPQLLSLAHAFEQATPWHNRRPRLD